MINPHKTPGHGGFFETESGEELLLTPDMFPELPTHLIAKNPYSHHDKRYQQWKSCTIARYYKKLYRAKVNKVNTNDFLAAVGDASDILANPRSWETYMEERELGKKRSLGRPPMAPGDRKRPSMKRSDQMRSLLLDNGIKINDDSSIDGFDGFEFMKNGRIKFLGDECAGIESYSLSAYRFLQDYL